MAECSLREAIHYARTSHQSPEARRGEAPVLYMNGWDVFEALPHLWHPDIDKLPSSTNPLTVTEYTRVHKSFGIPMSDDAINKRAASLCKLFIGPVGAITRIHQDNHEAHAWLCNIRGRKLYVLCRPSDSSKVAPPRSLSKAHGTCYSGRLDPLDPASREKAEENGLEIFATVLEPGQTIIAPDGWWHYAVSLTPTITLMNNFWDETNLDGIHDMLYLQFAKALDASKTSDHHAPHARHHSPINPLDPHVLYVAAHKPFVYIRESPAISSPMIGILRTGKTLLFGASQDGWIRTAQPYDKGRYGWALEDGAPLKLGRLLVPVSELISQRSS
uniref:JmjC domain-containing protein n=1 Tax=Haptolina brevifila TaxID=156173 RepID=A0A7S2NF84_9EUKA|mmetsp:Transcript_75898/g.150398  ORF Transcript_75898/g.150398 Transcript_75898/m.150398 type:complete len:331 (+) Transcript_75898:2-994(+)